MTRPASELHEISVHEWTAEEAVAHLTGTFDQACKDYPDVMEPFVNRLGDELDKVVFMRTALRETFNQRHPSMLRRSAE